MPRMGLDFTTVVAAAAALADEKGIDGISLGELAQWLNVRTPSLYNHVDSLEALKQSLAIYGLNQLYEQLQKRADGLVGDDAVYAMGDAYVAFARNSYIMRSIKSLSWLGSDYVHMTSRATKHCI